MRLNFNGDLVNSYKIINAKYFYNPLDNIIACRPTGEVYLAMRQLNAPRGVIYGYSADMKTIKKRYELNRNNAYYTSIYIDPTYDY